MANERESGTPRVDPAYKLLELYQDDTRYQLCQRLAAAQAALSAAPDSAPKGGDDEISR